MSRILHEWEHDIVKYSINVGEMMKVAKDIYDTAYARGKANEKTGWIPVSERLPEKGKQVLCCNKQGSVFTSAITYRNSSMVAFGQHCEVIAWMPLPQPYKGRK